MDIQFWIWLIIIVASILARALKKPAQRPQSAETPADDYDHNPNKPVSFEDLLREIQESKKPPRPIEQKKPIVLQPKSYEVDYDDDIPDEEQDYETVPTRKEDRSQAIYEKAKNEAFYRTSLEETLKLSQTDMSFTHFKGYEEAPKSNIQAEILNDFKDPEGFRKAFIMSEILKRKF